MAGADSGFIRAKGSTMPNNTVKRQKILEVFKYFTKKRRDKILAFFDMVEETQERMHPGNPTMWIEVPKNIRRKLLGGYHQEREIIDLLKEHEIIDETKKHGTSISEGKVFGYSYRIHLERGWDDPFLGTHEEVMGRLSAGS